MTVERPGARVTPPWAKPAPGGGARDPSGADGDPPEGRRAPGRFRTRLGGPMASIAASARRRAVRVPSRALAVDAGVTTAALVLALMASGRFGPSPGSAREVDALGMLLAATRLPV